MEAISTAPLTNKNNMESKVIRIEGRYEVWGFFQDGVLVRTRKLLIPFKYR